MANPAPTINQINAFNATQGTTIDFNIIGGTELVRSNRIYIYDLSDNSLICTHLYVSTESIHELPPNTDGSIVYESGKSSADFVNGAQYYAQIQTFTDIAGTEGGSGLSVAKMFWCLVDPTLTITTIPSTISTTSYNVSATYNANTSVVSNIIQQYQFNLYSAVGSLLQSSGVVVGSGAQQGTSTIYDISYNFTGLSVGSSYYVVVDVTTTQGMNVSTQSNTFTVSIDTPTLGEATVVNNACDGYISVTSNLSGEYGGSASGEIVSFETDSENVFTKLQVDLDPIQDLNGYDAPWVGGAGKNKLPNDAASRTINGLTFTKNDDGTVVVNGTASASTEFILFYDSSNSCPYNGYILTGCPSGYEQNLILRLSDVDTTSVSDYGSGTPIVLSDTGRWRALIVVRSGTTVNNAVFKPMIRANGTDATFAPYENICPISGHDEVGVSVNGVNQWDEEYKQGYYNSSGTFVSANNQLCTKNMIPVAPSTTYYLHIPVAEALNVALFEFNASGTLLRRTTPFTPSNRLFTTTENCKFILLNFHSEYGATYNNDISINYPSTDHEYHAYTGQSYHQDIEATYTPTVQENQAYLFKQTGDVGGDRETIELVGGTVAWNQFLNNGNFESSSGWSRYNADYITASIANNKCVITASQSFSGNDNSIIRRTDVANLVKNGNKYLVCVEVTNITSANTLTPRFEGARRSSAVNLSHVGNLYYNIYEASSNDAEFKLMMGGSKVAGDTWTYQNVQLFDLTAMFGSTIADYIYSLEQATAGAGVAFFRSLFPKPYYEYNAGELMSVNTSAHNTVGFNAWDEEWEVGGISNTTGNNATNNQAIRSKNYIPVIGGATYFFRCDASMNTYNVQSRFYDANKNYLGTGGTWYCNTAFTIPTNARYMRFGMQNQYGTTYKGDICINISDASKNGTYEPYVENTYPLDADLELRGIPKLDANNKLYYDGDTYKHVGSVNRKYGIVDLGTLNWALVGSTGHYRFRCTNTPSDMKDGVLNQISNIMCSSTLTPDTYNNVYGDVTDKTICVAYGNEKLCIYWSQYTDATQFKAALSGIYLLYELAAATTETADAFEEIQKVTPIYGTEEFADSRTVPMPVYTKTQYLTRDIYGGYIDLVSGKLTVDNGNKIYDGSNDESWTLQSINSYGIANFSTVVSDYVGESANQSMCNELEPQTSTIANTQTAGYLLNAYKELYIRVPSSIASTVAEFRTFLNSKPLQFVYKLATPQTYQLTPQQIQTLVGKNNVWSEQGEISLAYHIPITNLLVKRQDVDDVSGSWLTLYSQPITQASDMDFTFIDFTNQYGKTYKYALVPLLTQTQSGVEVEVEGGYTVSDEVQSVFDGVFIVDSTGSQKCKANVGYGNVDMNQTVGTITPIGAKYPVVITNSKNQYHNGSIYGTIVPDDYYFNGNLSRIDMVNKRDELEQFLTNKRAKIIKDWNGKIWLVMIMDNVSCTFNNNYGMGIVNFNTNWVEVGDPTNQQDLQATGLINVGGV